MRGAAMSLTAASSGFVVLLLTVPVIQGQYGWGVTYPRKHICASKGSTVEIVCIYRSPSRIKGRDTTVEKTFWFTKFCNDEPVDLRADSEYSGRVQHQCKKNRCTLRITDLRESDSAEYKFGFITNQPGGKYTDDSGVTLSVTGLQVQVIRLKAHDWVELKCGSSCRLPKYSYIWYKNGQKSRTETPSFSDYFYAADSFSCALKGHEDSSSPSVCVSGRSCNRVTYTDRRICVSKGSSVDISCTYNSYFGVESKFWFSPERNRSWQNPSEPEDLGKDSQYSGRVQVLEAERGRSTLRITDLTERESADYRFKFKTQSFEWRSSLPGTTLTVTVEWGKGSEGSSVTLTCSSDANPAANYTWYKENEDSPKASGQIFTITDLRPEHSGNYYCEAQNTRGRRNSTLNLTVVGGAWKLYGVAAVSAIVLAVILTSVFLWIMKKRVFKQGSEPGERRVDREQIQPAEQQDNVLYASVHFSKDHSVSSNIRPAPPRRHKKKKKEEEEMVEYAAVVFKSASAAARTRGQEAPEDPATLYSTVNKPCKKQ
ncbi:B-cell receptor CD22-like [Seriola lalandi dorsalis]|uniref:B-cell receptor CD22-like n=1 Tax=Seriola lalandi dorsalis TaxID=1841481 RepID=UPI000C6F69C4|nr:B-cell receptor CD22-like [Seriola lalandi dorsalis]